MSPAFLKLLIARRSEIECRWGEMLKLEGSANPLANPDVLAIGIAAALENVFKQAAENEGAPLSPEPLRHCECGRNPYRMFYIAGERAIAEVAVNVQFRQKSSERDPNDLTELTSILREDANSFIEAFCSVCMFRGPCGSCVSRKAR